MTKTFEKQLGNHAAHAARSNTGVKLAVESGNYQLAAFNCEQAFSAMLMQGLIVWRAGSNPTKLLLDAVNDFTNNWNAVRTIKGDDSRLSDAGFERVPFVAFLVDHPLRLSPSTGEFDCLQDDRILDAVLSQWLFNGWDVAIWDTGFSGLQAQGSKLANDTYAFYKQIAFASIEQMPLLESTAVELFKKRKNDAFYSGGEQTSGGGPDNAHTVDYRYAALEKKTGYKGTSIHAWRW